MVGKIDELKSNLSNKIEKGLVNIEEKIDEIDVANGTLDNAYNNCVINQQNNLKNDNDFRLKIAKPSEERFDHISKQEMMSILNQKHFIDSIDKFVCTMYFEPKAMHNCRWCVVDKTAMFGALEYNHESNTLVRKQTTEVITRNLQHILFGMNETLEELKSTTE